MVGQIPEFAYRDTRTPFPFPVISSFSPRDQHSCYQKGPGAGGVRTEDGRIFVLSSRHRQRDERAGLTRNVLNKFHSVGRCRLSLVKPNLGVKCCFVNDFRPNEPLAWRGRVAEPHNTSSGCTSSTAHSKRRRMRPTHWYQWHNPTPFARRKMHLGSRRTYTHAFVDTHLCEKVIL